LSKKDPVKESKEKKDTLEVESAKPKEQLEEKKAPKLPAKEEATKDDEKKP